MKSQNEASWFCPLCNGVCRDDECVLYSRSDLDCYLLVAARGLIEELDERDMEREFVPGEAK